MKDVNVLIIDDCEDTKQIVILLLKDNKDYNFIFKTAGNGKEGLKKLESFVPDIILLDLTMPIMNGFEFLEEMKKLNGRFKNTKILVMSSSCDTNDHHASIKLGAETFIDKFNLKKLLDKTMNKYINNKYNSNYMEKYIMDEL